MAAAEQLLRTRGLVGVTTRAIAEAVPCSEGAIYVHFKSRLELLVAVLESSLPDMLIPLHALDAQSGLRTPQLNLIQSAQGLRQFHERVAPMLGSLFAEPDLLASFREKLASRAKGPAGGIHRIADYIRKEQHLGRVAADVNAEVVAATLMSVGFFQAFTNHLLGAPVPTLSARLLVESLL